MQKPEMILFDYGFTLLYEPGADFLRGEEAVFPYIDRNPHGKTPKELCEAGLAIFRQMKECRHMGFEISEQQMMRSKYDAFGITFTIPPEQVEEMLWENVSHGACMPGIRELLALLEKQGIRSGVISNLGWSGAVLRRRINRLLPENRFEFVLASSEYAFRKPHPMMFRIALQKAGLSPDQVWFCGDSMAADILGAQGAGIFPVLYEGTADNGEQSPYLERNRQVRAEGEYLHIHHWQELMEIIK